MRNLCKSLVAAALVFGALQSTGAQPAAHRTMVANYAPTRAATAATPDPVSSALNPFSNIGLRGGAMVSPRGAGLVGLDYTIPNIVGLGTGAHTRIDADVIFKANLGGVNTIIPITVDQLYTSPASVTGRTVYYGGGIGAVLSGPAKFDGKLVLGMDLVKSLGAEVNVHFTERDTLLTILARFHM